MAEAAGHYEQAVQLSPDYIEPRFNLANTLAALGKPDGATTCLQQALQLALARNNPALVKTIRDRLQQLQTTGQ